MFLIQQLPVILVCTGMFNDKHLSHGHVRQIIWSLTTEQHLVDIRFVNCCMDMLYKVLYNAIKIEHFKVKIITIYT